MQKSTCCAMMCCACLFADNDSDGEWHGDTGRHRGGAPRNVTMQDIERERLAMREKVMKEKQDKQKKQVRSPSRTCTSKSVLHGYELLKSSLMVFFQNNCRRRTT